ncbi:MAG: hypothetical protein ACI9CQ_003644 [Saprospiraceae bacterium]|jgi:hypothetical protein
MYLVVPGRGIKSRPGKIVLELKLAYGQLLKPIKNMQSSAEGCLLCIFFIGLFFLLIEKRLRLVGVQLKEKKLARSRAGGC